MLFVKLRHRFSFTRNKSDAGGDHRSGKANSVQTSERPNESTSHLCQSYRHWLAKVLKVKKILCKIHWRNKEFKQYHLGQHDGESWYIKNRTSKIDRMLSHSILSVEWLFIAIDYLKTLESNLQNKRKLVRKLVHDNHSLQKCVLAKHEQWLNVIGECQNLYNQYRAWQFAVTLEDSGYSVLNQLDINARNLDRWQPRRLDPDNPSKLSALPWILIPENKLNFQTEVEEFWKLGEYQNAIQVAVKTLNTNKILPVTQQHRYPKTSIAELLKVISYFADLSVRCFRDRVRGLGLFCANYVIRLLIHLNPPKFSASRRKILMPERFIKLRECLGSLHVHETDWAGILEACRKIIQVFWLAGRHTDAIELVEALFTARVSNNRVEEGESQVGQTRLGCLLTSGVCLYVSHVSSLFSHMKRQENHVSLQLLELALLYSEGAIGIAAMDIKPKEWKLRPLLNEGELGAALYLWLLTIENICRFCSNLGSTHDVLFLAQISLSVYGHIKGPGGQALSQLLKLALMAEEEFQLSRIDTRLREEGKPNFSLDTYLSQLDCLDFSLDTYLSQLDCVEIPISIESIVHEVILVCRGQKWNSAAELLDWWVTGCKLLRQSHKARQKRANYTLNESAIRTDKLQLLNHSSVALKRKTIFLSFLNNLAQISLGNGMLGNDDSCALVASSSTGKHREMEPGDAFCNFSSRPSDPRQAFFSPIYKVFLPGFIEALESLRSFMGETKKMEHTEQLFRLQSNRQSLRSFMGETKTMEHSEQLFRLQSNRNLFQWCKGAHLQRGSTDVYLMPQVELLLDKKYIANMCENTTFLLTRDLGSASSLKNAKKSTIRRQQKNLLHAKTTPFPVVETLTPILQSKSYLVSIYSGSRTNSMDFPDWNVVNDIFSSNILIKMG
ncbi:hypothetical protein CSKR_103383 [Clonorchis sinensis]|uniref:Uncharacterized protein n=1 Tax=Clonorchis sinensis TaxID=79923 RepID=A0A3R7C7N5_CLOSI|nr:hypothetical protein CSKR_103383 [Clonorchis sinensis]